jgi:hypothetical protein
LLGAGAEAFKGAKASQEAVSFLTCMPYVTPACLATRQLNTLSPGLGLKLLQLPQTLPLMQPLFQPESTNAARR